MSGEHDNIEHSLNGNEVSILEILVRNAIDRQTKERPDSINEPDSIDEALHKLLEKLGRCYRGILYEHPHSDEIGRLVRNVLAPDALFERFKREEGEPGA
jgi:hypothetical protein